MLSLISGPLPVYLFLLEVSDLSVDVLLWTTSRLTLFLAANNLDHIIVCDLMLSQVLWMLLMVYNILLVEYLLWANDLLLDDLRSLYTRFTGSWVKWLDLDIDLSIPLILL